MKANKVFFDLYYSNKISDEDIVFVVLVDEAIYTKVKRGEMFARNIHHGCFLEHYSYETSDEVEARAKAFIERVGASYVSVDDFIRIEQETYAERVKKAFSVAEEMIRRG